MIARDRSPTLGACLAALDVAGEERPRIVPVGVDGPAMARNLVLGFTDADVLALVEDDVVVAPGWRAALAQAWDDPLVAVAGGPLAGPEGTATVDGPAATYPGGNVAFRTAALRGAGGFWPMRGHPHARDWFSEEHEVQRELARLGWTAAYVDDMAALRIGEPPPLRRRFSTGARNQALGTPRPAAASARGLVRSAAGAVAGRRRERLGRAAEHLGALLGPRAVRHELEPAATATPFLASVPPGPHARQRHRKRRHERGTVLLYHRLAAPERDPLGLSVAPERFAEQLDVLRDRGVRPLEEIAAGAPGVALTFDDGYADTLALRNAGVPVTLFVTTGAIGTDDGFWWDRIERVCHERAGERLAIEDRAFVLGPHARRHLHQWLQPRPPEAIAAVLEALDAPEGDRALTHQELAQLHASGVAIGAHTRSHRSLQHASPAEQREEVEGSRDDLAAWCGSVPTAFSYPFGVPGEAFDATSRRIVRDAGFTLAVANHPDPTGDLFAVPRRVVPDVGGEKFARWLDRTATPEAF